jgi:hypothetical protein
LFSLQCGPDGFSKPITIEDENGRWVNILDPDDPIGYKLKGLNDAYDKAVAADCEINTGGFGISHLKYWDNRMVQRMMARKLAIDWASTNGLIDKEKSMALYRARRRDQRGLTGRIRRQQVLSNYCQDVSYSHGFENWLGLTRSFCYTVNKRRQDRR